MDEELQIALIGLLSAEVAPLTVYGAVPQDTAVPYYVAGEPQSDDASTDTSTGALYKIRVSYYDKAGALSAANLAIGKIRAALHHKEDALSLSLGAAVTMYVEGTSVEEPSDEGKARETAVSVAILIDDITAGTT